MPIQAPCSLSLERGNDQRLASLCARIPVCASLPGIGWDPRLWNACNTEIDRSALMTGGMNLFESVAALTLVRDSWLGSGSGESS
jgi:hypothetical protein